MASVRKGNEGPASGDAVGPLGKVVGMTRFGAPAPYKVLDEKFGYTPAHVAGEVTAYLETYRQTRKHLAEVS